MISGSATAGPEATASATTADPANLLAEVAAEMLHEARQLLLLVDGHEQVQMIREHDRSTNLQRRNLERSAHDADHDLVEPARLGRRHQQ